MEKKDIIKSIESGYTSRANPRRGYHDSHRTVTFEGGTEDEQRAVMDEMRTELEPGNMWCGSPQKVKPDVWSINYGYDSGD
jgi:hypothetical protein